MSIRREALQDFRQRADDVLCGAVASGAVAGVAAILATREDVIYEGGAGVRGLGAAGAMDCDSICWIASMTKPLTAIAALQLVERGVLGLDTPARDVAPELGDLAVLTGFDDDGAPQLRPPTRPITLRQLLTHTSGLGYELFSADVAKAKAALGLPGLAHGKIAALKAPLLFDPGARWEYGVGIDWAGLLVEAASGRKLGAYLADHVFAPLGMTSTGFALSSAMRERLAGMHMRVGETLMAFPLEQPQDGEFEPGGSGLYSTARDYTRLVRMILGDGALEGRRVIRPESMALLRDSQIGDLRVAGLTSASPLSRDMEFFPGVAKGWSLAFAVNLEPAPTGRPAGGLMWAGLSNCYFWIDPVNGLSGVVLAQVLPFADPRAMGVWLDFETAAYAAGLTG